MGHDHANSTVQLINSFAVKGVNDFGAGDLAGLRLRGMNRGGIAFPRR